MSASCACAAALLALSACERGPTAAEQRALEADARTLQHVMGSDPTEGLLSEVEDQVSRERPITAAGLLAQAAIPAARKQVDAVRRAPVRTQTARELRSRLVGAYLARAGSLVLYQRALARGVVEDIELIDAMRAVRGADERIVGLADELGATRPLR